MTWVGRWRNQYGSVVEITDESNHKIAGVFRAALTESAFFGQEIAMIGVHQGDCISFAGGGSTPAGDMVVSYAGLLRNGRMETLWFVAADASFTVPAKGSEAKVQKLNWWRAMTTNADTFERVP